MVYVISIVIVTVLVTAVILYLALRWARLQDSRAPPPSTTTSRPADAPSTKPLVTVIYDPNAVGDGNYNDLIYQGVEQAAKEHDLRTMQLSPSTRDEGLAYLQTLFEQMSTAQDTVRRLFIVAAARQIPER